MSRPVLAIVGATGLLGPGLLSSFTKHGLKTGELAAIKVLTSNPSNPNLSSARTANVDIIEIDYTQSALRAALSGVDILVSALGFQPNKGDSSTNMRALIEAAAAANVKIYVPSDFGVDHNEPSVKALQLSIFELKQRHHNEAEQLGLKVHAFYTGLALEPIWPFIGLDLSTAAPDWTIPTPARQVAFSSLEDFGRFVLSAVVQSFEGAEDIPSKLRVFSDSMSLEEAASAFEQATAARVRRHYNSQQDLEKERKETNNQLPLPLLTTLGALDFLNANQNYLVLRGRFTFKPKTVRDYFNSLPKFNGCA